MTTGDEAGEWAVAETPTDATLYAVVQTAAGPHAVGEDGVVLARRTDSPDDDGWRVVVEAGPGARRNTLRDAAVTAGGERVWFAGSSGALGAYDVAADRKHDHSAPMEKTSTWEAVAVAGPRDAESLRAANGSGEVLPVATDDDGCPEWGEVSEPGSGSSVAGLASDGRRFFVADTNGGAFEERGTDRTDISPRNAEVDFHDVAASEATVRIAGDGGLVYRYDRVCRNWTPCRVGETALRALAVDGDAALAVGAGGRAYRRTPTTGWRSVPTPVEESLRDVALGGSGDAVGETDVAVGESGVVIER
ncbi:hypothetical protein [Halorussus sp. AFM4]|uniref:hypothetical protein n=1 Tax=Halorussus sp. AFM4 TaxID=3421651 RepID=UPI003EC102F6